MDNELKDRRKEDRNVNSQEGRHMSRKVKTIIWVSIAVLAIIALAIIFELR